eukprot:COSAG01_NODE_2947_length_6810_cov_12.567342_1_plen_44_part_00
MVGCPQSVCSRLLNLPCLPALRHMQLPGHGHHDDDEAFALAQI